MREPSDIRLGGIVIGALIIVTGIGASLGLAWLLFPGEAARAPQARPALLQTVPHRELERFRREKYERLHGGGPVEDAGRVHIPIERAMQILAEGKPQ